MDTLYETMIQHGRLSEVLAYAAERAEVQDVRSPEARALAVAPTLPSPAGAPLPSPLSLDWAWWGCP